QKLSQAIFEAKTLSALVCAAWAIGLWIAKGLVEQELMRRATEETDEAHCHRCGRRLHSQGFEPRQMTTVVGKVNWRRRGRRCPNQCPQSQKFPLDEALGIEAYQQSSHELKRLGCLFAIFVPYGLSRQLLWQFTAIEVSDDTLWNWVQSMGQETRSRVESQLEAFEAAEAIATDSIEQNLAKLILAIAVDGVTVPLRPYPKNPKGKTLWREVKVGVLARLRPSLTQTGQAMTRLSHRRLVAVMDNLERFRRYLQLEAHRCQIDNAAQVLWLSDGAKGFWNLYEQSFSHVAIGILDFYHAAQHLSPSATRLFPTENLKAQRWFESFGAEQISVFS
ncbi:MAG: ISKra4-like element ISLesp2 family transposase, partial [Microcystaceae cyanobacterium]